MQLRLMNDSQSFHLFTLGAGQSGLSFYTTQRDAAGVGMVTAGFPSLLAFVALSRFVVVQEVLKFVA